MISVHREKAIFSQVTQHYVARYCPTTLYSSQDSLGAQPLAQEARLPAEALCSNRPNRHAARTALVVPLLNSPSDSCLDQTESLFLSSMELSRTR